jgi:hypothetical protein
MRGRELLSLCVAECGATGPRHARASLVRPLSLHGPVTAAILPSVRQMLSQAAVPPVVQRGDRASVLPAVRSLQVVP